MRAEATERIAAQDPAAAVAKYLWLQESSRADLFERKMLRVLTHGDGCWVYDVEGDRYFDVVSTLWAAPLGHGREEIIDAMAAQARKVASAGPVFYATEATVAAAERLAALTPGDLSRSVLCSSGSEVTEAALKLARQYHRLRGEPHRFKYISRYGSYHGASFGALSVSGKRWRDAKHYPTLPGCIQIGDGSGRNTLESAEELRVKIELEGPDTVAAFITDTIAFADFRIPDDGYWPRIREICDEYEILLILDETLVGCCRTGEMWAIDHWGVVPDILLTAKALTAGYAPCSAMVVRDGIYEEFPDDVPLAHMQSWGGHGVAAAAADKALEIYDRENMPAVARTAGEKLLRRLEGLGSNPVVKEVRGLGLWIAIEFMDPETGESLAQGMKGRWMWGRELMQLLHEVGCLAPRMSEGVLQISPPFVSSDDELEFVASATEEVVARMERAIREERDEVARRTRQHF
jgi:adenosylmethionine-8-amino-7-oxononanoate aminotransferase